MLEHLPPFNPVQRELDDTSHEALTHIARDIANQLRSLNVSYFNAHRGKQPQATATYIPPLDDARHARDTRPPEQVDAERRHLEGVLSRDVAR